MFNLDKLQSLEQEMLIIESTDTTQLSLDEQLTMVEDYQTIWNKYLTIKKQTQTTQL